MSALYKGGLMGRLRHAVHMLIYSGALCALLIALASMPAAQASGATNVIISETSTSATSAGASTGTTAATDAAGNVSYTTAAVTTASSTAASSSYVPLPEVTSADVALETSDGTVLYTLASDGPVHMASTTKIMTAVVALESGVALDTIHTFTTIEERDGDTTAGYVAGDTATLRELLEAMLIHSAGDAADAVAETVAGTQEAFVALMNARAQQLGMSQTHYTSPSGYYDQDNYTTPTDLLTVLRHAMQIATFREILAMDTAVISAQGVFSTLSTTNVLLNAYPGMMGGKTGYTLGANSCFAGVVRRGGITLYVCVLGAQNNQLRWDDCLALLNYGFALFPETQLLPASTLLPAVGYVQCGMRFGLVSPTTAAASLSTRLDTSGISASTVLATASAGAGSVASFCAPGQSVASITWTNAADTVGSRSVSVGSEQLPACSFGPFVTPLMYQN